MILVGVLSRVLCLALFCLAVIACAVCMLFCLDVVEAWEISLEVDQVLILSLEVRSLC